MRIAKIVLAFFLLAIATVFFIGILFLTPDVEIDDAQPITGDIDWDVEWGD